MSEAPTLAPPALDERRMADSLVASANKISRWLNAASLHPRQSAKDELQKLIVEAGKLWSVL